MGCCIADFGRTLGCGLSDEMRPKCGPFHHFGPHEDQVRNYRPLRKHCLFKAPNSPITNKLSVAF